MSDCINLSFLVDIKLGFYSLKLNKNNINKSIDCVDNIYKI